MNKLFNITPKYCNQIPSELKEGVIYISKEHDVAIHLCACKCGRKTVTPLGKNGWSLTDKNGLITLSPSIGNFKGESPYHAHYFIIDNRIKWV